VTAFVAGDTADYKKSDAIAEMAIKWAQERREKLEVSLVIKIYVLYTLLPYQVW